MAKIEVKEIIDKIVEQIRKLFAGRRKLPAVALPKVLAEKAVPKPIAGRPALLPKIEKLEKPKIGLLKKKPHQKRAAPKKKKLAKATEALVPQPKLKSEVPKKKVVKKAKPHKAPAKKISKPVIRKEKVAKPAKVEKKEKIEKPAQRAAPQPKPKKETREKKVVEVEKRVVERVVRVERPIERVVRVEERRPEREVVMYSGSAKEEPVRISRYLPGDENREIRLEDLLAEKKKPAEKYVEKDIKKEMIETEYDKVLNCVKEAKTIKLSEIIKKLNVEQEVALAHLETLETDGLIDLKYPPIGEPVAVFKGEKKKVNEW